MTEIAQKIFKRSFVYELRNQVKSEISLEEYFNRDFNPPDGSELDSAIKLPADSVALEIAREGSQAGLDFQNAVRLHEVYKDLSEAQASDHRLWTYLTHVTFRSYTMDRWPIGVPFEAVQKDKSLATKAANNVLSHWFAAGTDRALRRNAIARLWWAVHLTVSPWKRDPNFYNTLPESIKSDPHVFTKALFSTQDVFQQVLERSIGRDNRILIGVLAYVNDHGAPTREQIRDLMKELNLIASVRNLSLLSREDLWGLIQEIAEDK